MKEIITRDYQKVLVDDEDYPFLIGYKWKTDENGYAICCIHGCPFIHRMILKLEVGDKHVHHKNENRLDNRKENLELLSKKDHLKRHRTFQPEDIAEVKRLILVEKVDRKIVAFKYKVCGKTIDRVLLDQQYKD